MPFVFKCLVLLEIIRKLCEKKLNVCTCVCVGSKFTNRSHRKGNVQSIDSNRVSSKTFVPYQFHSIPFRYEYVWYGIASFQWNQIKPNQTKLQLFVVVVVVVIYRWLLPQVCMKQILCNVSFDLSGIKYKISFPINGDFSLLSFFAIVVTFNQRTCNFALKNASSESGICCNLTFYLWAKHDIPFDSMCFCWKFHSMQVRMFVFSFETIFIVLMLLTEI